MPSCISDKKNKKMLQQSRVTTRLIYSQYTQCKKKKLYALDMRNAKSSSVQHQIYIYERELITQAANWEDQPASQPEQMIRHKCESIIPSSNMNKSLHNLKSKSNLSTSRDIQHQTCKKYTQSS